MIKAITKLSDASEANIMTNGMFKFTKDVDVRDLLVRMHSDDQTTAQTAKKTLLNFLAQDHE